VYVNVYARVHPQIVSSLQRDQVQPRFSISRYSDIRRHYKTISSNKFTLARRTVTAFFHTLPVPLD
jgi:hypothetical protein